MAEDPQAQEIGPPPSVSQLVPELADASLMAACELRKTCRNEIHALLRLYDKRYAKRRDDFLKGRSSKKPLSKSEINKFHERWRAYVRGVVEPLFKRARRAARLDAFVQEHERALGCVLVSSAEARQIAPFIDLAALVENSRLRRVQFESTEFYYAQDDIKKIAVEDAKLIETLRQKHDARERENHRKREEDTMKRRLRMLLYEHDVGRDVAEHLTQQAASFESVQALFDTEHFSMSWDLSFPNDCTEFLEKALLEAHSRLEKDAGAPCG